MWNRPTSGNSASTALSRKPLPDSWSTMVRTVGWSGTTLTSAPWERRPRPAADTRASAGLGLAARMEEVPEAAYDPGARLEAMAEDGVEAEVVYSTIGTRIYTSPVGGELMSPVSEQ